MSNKLKQILQLTPVKTAPFFAAGILLCAGGGTAAVVLIIAAALLTLLLLKFHRNLLPCIMALLLGMLAISANVLFMCRPLEEYADTQQQITLRVAASYSSSGYSYCEGRAWIGGRRTTLGFYADREYLPGDVLDMQVSLSLLPYGGSESREQVLAASVEEVYRHTRPKFSLRRSIHEFRSELKQEIAMYISGEAGALAQGLLFGDTSGFSAEMYHAAKISGVVHFTAVSGSHFVIITAVLLEFAGKRKLLRSVLALLCVPMAVLFFGSEPSVVRAGIMVFLCNCGPLFSRCAESINSLAVAVILMTAFTPYVMLDIGFQMSVLGVFGVSVVAPQCIVAFRRHIRSMHAIIKGCINAMIMSACAVICIAPISVAAFGGASLTGVFATLALTPVFTAALTLAVIYAVTGLSPVLIPVNLLMKAAYYIIMFFGCESRLWLAMNFPYAGAAALVAAVSLTVAAVFGDKRRSCAAAVFSASVVISVALSLASGCFQRKIEFVSNGSSGAAIVCIKDHADILICGNGAGLETDISDQLLRNGIHSINSITAEQLGEGGVNSLATLCKLYPTKEITANTLTAAALSERIPETNVRCEPVQRFSIDGFTIACAKAGDTDVTADIVMYYSYKKSQPDYSCTLPLYISSRQEILPQNGVNIFDTHYELKLNLSEN